MAKAKASKPKMMNVMFRDIPADLWHRLKIQAAHEGIFLKKLIVRILDEGSKAKAR